MDVNITIIGAGVIGLAIAAKLSETNDNIFVVERHKQLGQETSSRNSEVIHSGIYYPKGSLKAQLCVKGKEQLYKTCKEEEIPFNNCGKLIVATTEDEVPELDKLYEKAIGNGVYDLQFLDQDQVKEMEPNVSAIKALFSPSTGIIDTHSLMKYFEKTAIINGVDFAYASEVKGLEKIDNGYKVELKDADENQYFFTSSIVISCTGLEADRISQYLGIDDKSYKIHFCKGEYFRVNPPKNRLVHRLIYPVPGKKLVSLGVHSTIDLSGGLKLGPSAFYLDQKSYDYSVNSENRMSFYHSTKKFLPFIEPDDLSPDMAGIRPKVQGPGESIKDFIIRNETKRGFPGFINLVGMESPGLTSCIAIAEYVEELI